VKRTGLALLLAATACEGTLPPLRRLGEVGRDPVVLFVGGERGQGDLFAASTSGGEVIQLTFSPVPESRPSLSPEGGAVAFLRDSTVWVMNLVSGSERRVRLPKGAGIPERVGWAPDGRSLVVGTVSGLYRWVAPPKKGAAVEILGAERAAGESSLAVLLGSPAFTRVIPCERTADLCGVGDTAAPSLLAADAHDAVRWGSDSVGYFVGDELRVRPLGPGRERTVELRNPPASPREPTMFPGATEPR
jgi:hypothetical protein